MQCLAPPSFRLAFGKKVSCLFALLLFAAGTLVTLSDDVEFARPICHGRATCRVLGSLLLVMSIDTD